MFKVGDKVRIIRGRSVDERYLSSGLIGKEVFIKEIKDIRTRIIIELINPSGRQYEQVAHPSELELLSPILYKYVI